MSISCPAVAARHTDAQRVPLNVTANDVADSDSGMSACGNVGASGTSTLVTGGSGNYSYSWSQVGTPATNGPYNINSATLQNPSWSGTPCDGDQITETWQLDVTDDTTGQTGSTTITVSLEWTDLT